MKRLLHQLNIAVLAASVISASVLASHIPPLWGPFTASVLIMAGSLFLRRKNTRDELLDRAIDKNPVVAFGDLIRSAIATVEELSQKKSLGAQEEEMLGNLTEHLTIGINQIHPALIEALGKKHFIEVILPFARGERLLHRAFSALTDHYVEEAFSCLTECLPFLREARLKLEESPLGAIVTENIETIKTDLNQ